ncbi:hypothetical protein PVAP13_6NG013031 [Panicum virgatum]|uniref:Uncharacterized protein n=1 Tax=Panicum virgatum TaxID=38727 RepID=A0A8T0QT35_PANVG|nr:hypothetical protein PVAP13_6NG013031 [Panicum virgatum]
MQGKGRSPLRFPFRSPPSPFHGRVEQVGSPIWFQSNLGRVQSIQKQSAGDANTDRAAEIWSRGDGTAASFGMEMVALQSEQQLPRQTLARSKSSSLSPMLLQFSSSALHKRKKISLFVRQQIHLTVATLVDY